MAKRADKLTISSVLRDALKMAADQTSLLHMSAETGIAVAIMSRFVRGERTLTLPTADKLAEYLGLELRPRR